MILELPDRPGFEARELRLELACALYARGKLGKISAAEFGGVDFFTFQRALSERGVPLYTEEMLQEDVRNSGKSGRS